MVEKNEEFQIADPYGEEENASWGLGSAGDENEYYEDFRDEPNLMHKKSSYNEQNIYTTDKSKMPFKLFSKKDIIKMQQESI